MPQFNTETFSCAPALQMDNKRVSLALESRHHRDAQSLTVYSGAVFDLLLIKTEFSTAAEPKIKTKLFLVAPPAAPSVVAVAMSSESDLQSIAGWEEVVVAWLLICWGSMVVVE